MNLESLMLLPFRWIAKDKAQYGQVEGSCHTIHVWSEHISYHWVNLAKGVRSESPAKTLEEQERINRLKSLYPGIAHGSQRWEARTNPKPTVPLLLISRISKIHVPALGEQSGKSLGCFFRRVWNWRKNQKDIMKNKNLTSIGTDPFLSNCWIFE